MTCDVRLVKYSFTDETKVGEITIFREQPVWDREENDVSEVYSIFFGFAEAKMHWHVMFSDKGLTTCSVKEKFHFHLFLGLKYHLQTEHLV